MICKFSISVGFTDFYQLWVIAEYTEGCVELRCQEAKNSSCVLVYAPIKTCSFFFFYLQGSKIEVKCISLTEQCSTHDVVRFIGICSLHSAIVALSLGWHSELFVAWPDLFVPKSCRHAFLALVWQCLELSKSEFLKAQVECCTTTTAHQDEASPFRF